MLYSIDRKTPAEHLEKVSAEELKRIGARIEAAGFKVVREYVGHGVGRNMHEDPNVPNYGKAGKGLRLVEGMVIAIEPMVNMKSHRTKRMKDGWTVKTVDGMPSAHYEKTVAITADGPVILTQE